MNEIEHTCPECGTKMNMLISTDFMKGGKGLHNDNSKIERFVSTNVTTNTTSVTAFPSTSPPTTSDIKKDVELIIDISIILNVLIANLGVATVIDGLKGNETDTRVNSRIGKLEPGNQGGIFPGTISRYVP